MINQCQPQGARENEQDHNFESQWNQPTAKGLGSLRIKIMWC